MAIVFEEALKKNISSGKLLPVYIFFGQDSFLKKNYSDKIGKKITDTDDIFNYSKFTADCNLQEVYDFVMQIPLMCDYKYAELSDFDFEHCSKTDFDKLCSLLTEVPDTAVLVLRFESIEIDTKKNAKFKKLVAAAEKNGGIAVDLGHRKPAELVKMLTDGASKKGCVIKSDAARYLVETAGEDITLLGNELSKLCAFVGKGEITKQTVEKICIKTVEASVYNITKYIFATDTANAMKTLDELFFMRIEPMIILYTISSVYVDMYRVYAAKSQKQNISAVASTFGYKGREFVLEKAAQNLKRFDLNKLQLSLDALAATDKALKSYGSEPRIILEQLIIKLIYIIVKGEAVDKG